uniref:Uncharacterized protein n=1 Tax=Rheinheimera sp. BAL341 TaxID=1708203 RepID=A0A486XHJ6_9GAMM
MKLITLTNTNINISELSALCQPQDAILLRQDAVFLCLRHDICWPVKQLYVLDIDVQVRKVSVPDNFSMINPERWVALTIAAKVNLLWPN